MCESKTNFEVIRYREVDSTNSIALAKGIQGADHGTVVLAKMQTGGKGRLSRTFSSPLGGMYVSVILRPNLPEHNLPLVTLAAGVASACAIEKITGVGVQLKWPNDLYVKGMKLGGILTEAAPYSQKTHSIPFVVVGIGVNVNTQEELFPDSLQDIATSLYCQTGHTYDINGLLVSLMDSLLPEVKLLEENPQQVLEHWRVRDYLLKKNLCWQTPQGKRVHGTGKGLLPDGRYRLMTSDGEDCPVLSGDIQITEIER